MPRVSIVMPTYNSREFIDNAIGDILNQTYNSFELILVDDGSSDGTAQMLNEYKEKDDRIRVFVQNHLGAGAARNTGIKEAAGEYILFLDSDDRFESRLLEHTVNQADKNQTDILLYDASCVDGKTGISLDSDFMYKKEHFPKCNVFSWEDCAEWILDICHSAVWTKLYRTSFVQQSGIRFQNTPYMNDVFFHHVTLLEAKRVAYLDEKLLEYKMFRKGSISSADRYMGHPMVAIDVVESVRKYLNDRGIYEKCKHGFLANSFNYLIGNLQDIYDDANLFFTVYPMYKEYLLEELGVKILTEFLSDEDWRKVRLDRLCKYNAAEYIFYFYRDCLEHIFYVDLDNRVIKKDVEYFINNKHWVFDSSILQEGERIIIYGAGEVGKDYHNQLTREKNVKVVGWVDKNRNKLKTEEGVEPVDILQIREFDRIIVAVRNNKVANEIKNDLCNFFSEDRVIMPEFD